MGKDNEAKIYGQAEKAPIMDADLIYILPIGDLDSLVSDEVARVSFISTCSTSFFLLSADSSFLSFSDPRHTYRAQAWTCPRSRKPSLPPPRKGSLETLVRWKTRPSYRSARALRGCFPLLRLWVWFDGEQGIFFLLLCAQSNQASLLILLLAVPLWRTYSLSLSSQLDRHRHLLRLSLFSALLTCSL